MEDYRNKWLILTAVSAGIFLSTIDGGIVNLALPTLVRYFSVPVAQARWTVLAYLVTVAALMLPFGRLGDRFGKKGIYGSGFVIFTAASALCGLASGMQSLILFRVVQAIGAAMMISLGMGIVAEAFPPRERGKALGITGSIVSAGIIAGPAIGGFLLDHFVWRSIFYVNVPIGMVGVTLVARFVPATKRAVAQHKVKDLLRVPGFLAALLSAFVFFALSAGTNFLWPFYIEDILHHSSSEAGLLMAVIPASVAVVSPLAGTLADRWGTTRINRLGVTLLVIGYSALLLLGESSPLGTLALVMIPLGVGTGFFQASNNTFLMSSAPRPMVGFVSSLVAFSRSSGFAVGVLLFSTLWSLGVAQGPSGSHIRVLHGAFVVAAIIALATAVPTFLLAKRRGD